MPMRCDSDGGGWGRVGKPLDDTPPERQQEETA